MLALAAFGVLLAIIPVVAGAAAPSRLWQRCDGGKEDIACLTPRGVAVSRNEPGHVFIVDQDGFRIIEFDAWGQFVKTWGWDVVASGPHDTAPVNQFEICVPASDDVCKVGIRGNGGSGGAGQFNIPEGIAVDSAGDVYVFDPPARRVQKFDSGGHFLRMFGGEVNTGSGNPGICTNAGPPTDICKEGTTGGASGQFGTVEPLGSYIAIDTRNTPVVTDDKVYVGDVGRIQRFNSDGEWQANVPLPGESVNSLAVDSTGNLYTTYINSAGNNKSNVRKLNPTTGAETRTYAVPNPRAVAVAANNQVYAFDKASTQIFHFNPAGEELEEPFGEGLSAALTGLATGSACLTSGTDLYVSNKEPAFLRAYGPPPNKGGGCAKPAKAPDIVDQYALSAGTTEARLRAEIDPRFWETTYWVQYASAACFEAGGWGAPCVIEHPAPPGASLGFDGDGAARSAAVLLVGLAPDTAYRFRFAAESGGGGPVFGTGGKEGGDGTDGSFRTLPSPLGPIPCPNAALRLGAAAFLPDCRGYEMVSPVDKEGADIEWATTLEGVPVARNQSDPAGNKLTFTASRRFGDGLSQPYAPQYIASRGAGGWSSHGISPPRGVLRGPVTSGGDNEFRAFSEDLCSAWLVNDDTTAPPLAPGGLEESNNLYERSNCGAGADSYRLVRAGNAEPQGFTPDATKAIFRAGGMVFEADGGEAQAVCVLPDLTAPSFGCSAGTAGIDGYEHSLSHAISDDGSRVFFSAGGGTVFVRKNPMQPQSALEHGAAKGTGDLSNGSSEVTNLSTTSGAFEVDQTITGRGIPFGTTITAVAPGSLTLSAAASETRAVNVLSAYSECTEAEKACTVPVSESVSPGAFEAQFTTQAARFWGAAADGSRALFSFDPDLKQASDGPAREELYEFDVASETPTLIAHNALGVLGASEDLTRIYLASTEVLIESEEAIENEEEGRPNPVAGEANLYLYEAGGGGSFAFIGTLSRADANLDTNLNPTARRSFPTSPIPIGHTARVSPGGEVAAFTSTAPLTGYDNRDAESGEADREVFRYEAAMGELSCVSCDPSGARPAGRFVTALEPRINAYWAAAQIPGAEHSLYFSRALSDDGSRLFFESFEPLVSRDTNGRKDVYEWEAPGTGSCSEESGDFSAPAEGCVSLISSGESELDSSFVDASPSGNDVFFTTASSLVALDPGLIDIYDARVGGGFKPPDPPAPPCEGEACQSPLAPPDVGTPASSAFQDAGNLPPSRKHSCGKGKRRVTRNGKQRCVAKQSRHHKRHGRANHDRRASR